MASARPDVNGPAEKLITELQQSRKMHMIEYLQVQWMRSIEDISIIFHIFPDFL
jgi:hypothetical protein